MARYNANRYQYETSPRKLQPEYTPVKKKYPKKSTASKKTINAQKQAKASENKNIKIMLYIGIIFAILFAVSYRNALVAQKYSELKNLKVQLSKIEKENEQLEVNIESKTNLSAIEKRAEEELGMKKLDDSQTVYVSLDKSDYIESAAESVKLEDNLNWFEIVINQIKNMF